jgi:hypothetical protein
VDVWVPPLSFVSASGYGRRQSWYHLRRWRGLAPPEQGSNSGKQFLEAERLVDIIVGTHLEAHNLVHLLSPGGEHQNGDGAVKAQEAADVIAMKFGQHQIQNDEVRLLISGQLQGLNAGGGSHHLMIVANQVVSQEL